MLHSNERIIKRKVGLLNLAEELGNVSKACQMMGLSRGTFYRYRSAIESGGIDALLEKNGDERMLRTAPMSAQRKRLWPMRWSRPLTGRFAPVMS